MNRAEFQSACEDYVENGTHLTLADVLDLTYQKIIRFEKPRLLEKRVNGRVLRTLAWLEIVFFADVASDAITFYGIQTPIMDMTQGGNVTHLPGIALDKPAR